MAVTAQGTSSPILSLTDINPAHSTSTLNGDSLPQHWIFVAPNREDGEAYGALYTSLAAYHNAGCAGGCVDNNTRCTPGSCPRTQPSTFQCFQPNTEDPIVAPCPTGAGVFAADIDTTKVSVSTLRLQEYPSSTPPLCLESDFPNVVYSPCAGLESQDWVLTRLEAPALSEHLQYFRISRPAAPYDCITLSDKNIPVMAPCFACAVGISTMAYEEPGDKPYLVAFDTQQQSSEGAEPVSGIPDFLDPIPVYNPVSDTLGLVLDRNAPNKCLAQDASWVECGQVTRWAEVDPHLHNPIGAGKVIAGTYQAEAPLRAVICTNPCTPGTRTVTGAAPNATATIVCDTHKCIAKPSPKNRAFEFGESVFLLNTNELFGHAIIEQAIIQPAPQFGIAGSPPKPPKKPPRRNASF